MSLLDADRREVPFAEVRRVRLTATISRDLFVRDFDTAFESPDAARRSRESFILQLLSHGYDVTLLPITEGILNA